MLTVDDFAKLLTKRAKRRKPYSRSYVMWLINGGKIQPPPEKIGKGRGVYIFDDDAKVIK